MVVTVGNVGVSDKSKTKKIFKNKIKVIVDKNTTILEDAGNNEAVRRRR